MSTSLSAPEQLRVEGRISPLGLGAPQSELSWEQPVSGQRGYRVQVATEEDLAAPHLVWDSGPVRDPRPFGVVYAGEPLRTRTRYWWRVRVETADGETPWSEPAWFETGLMGGDTLHGEWITADEIPGEDDRTLYLRRMQDLAAPVVRARAYVAALGWYHLVVNGTDLTERTIVPGWTPFDEMAEYQVHDVTDVLRQGSNTIGIALADGRFRGTLGFDLIRAHYGDRTAVLAEVVIDLADGSRHVLVTDTSWRVGRGRVRSADPVLGERVDLRVDGDAWMDPDQPLEDEQDAVVLPEPATRRMLVAESAERLTAVAALTPTLLTSPARHQVLDFGQTFTGIVSLPLSGTPGTTVRLLYSEALQPDGEIDTRYLPPQAQGPETWFQRDEVVLADHPVLYTPWFTIRGMRYLSIEGADPVDPAGVEGIVMSTRMDTIAEFSSSDPHLDRLWTNALWSLRSNFLDTATDCPTRERSGWTGDLQVFGPTAVQMAACAPFLRRYLHYLGVEQYDDGRVPPYIPSEKSVHMGHHPMEYTSTSVGWGDVATMLPWTMYWYRGDTRVLADQYDSARRWADHLAWRAAMTQGSHRRVVVSRIGDLERYIVDTGFHWGEWLRPGEGNTWWDSMLRPPAAIATAYLARSAQLVARMAEVLGRTDDAERYRRLSEDVALAWRTAFVHEDGARIGDDRQDDYVRALAFDLIAPAQRPRALSRLLALIEEADDHLGTGFLSTGLLLPVLAHEGRADVACRLLFQRGEPSWLAQVERGATTILESWNGIDEHGRAHDSQNHYAFGSVVRFLQEDLAGLAPAAPGYRTIRFAPVLAPQLSHAGVRVRTPYGTASSSWRRDADVVRLTVVVPPGCRGIVNLPGLAAREVGSGEHVLSTPGR